MTESAKKLIVSLLESKKFTALVLGLVVTLASYPLVRWAGMAEAEAASLAAEIAEVAMAGVAAYVMSQGIADHGKEAAKEAGKSRGVE